MTTNKASLSRLTKVRHRNELNSTLSTLPMAAKKVLFLAMCQINSKNEFDDDHIFYVTVADYIKWVQVKSDAAYLALKEGANILDTTLLKLKHDEILELGSELGLNFTKSNVPDSMNLSLTIFSSYYRNEGRVGIKFTKEAKRFLCKLIGEEKRYTTQVLLSVVRLTSVNAASLYQLIRKIYSNNARANSFEMTIEELKDELNLYTIGAGGMKDYKYPDYPAFKRDVLNKSIKEIMKHTEVKNL
ncbi:replication initiation protein, partial [Escherichia coli]|nr:replication initiation protein [Escherichia coli]